jgi:hypothetical protein
MHRDWQRITKFFATKTKALPAELAADTWAGCPIELRFFAQPLRGATQVEEKPKLSRRDALVNKATCQLRGEVQQGLLADCKVSANLRLSCVLPVASPSATYTWSLRTSMLLFL